jgi:rhodanese-related sulfurtransferase
MEKTAKQAFKAELYGEFARIGKALSSGRRLELLELLAQGERTVEELARETEMSLANASQHLQILRQAQLIEGRRAGTYIHYCLRDERVLRLWLSLREVGEKQIAEIERVVSTFFEDRAALQAMTSTELRERLKSGSIVVVDVRPEREYRAGHVQGARSIPVEELEARLRELPKKRTIVAYCRGPYCVFADEAVRLLRERGYKAVRLEEGFPEWKMRGFAIETVH